MTNESWILTQMSTVKLAKMILYHDRVEEWDINYDDEWECICLKDVWIAHDGNEFEDLSDAILYEVNWLTSQFERGG